MIDHSTTIPSDTDLPRDELSMRVMEYVMAFVALAAAVLIAIN